MGKVTQIPYLHLEKLLYKQCQIDTITTSVSGHHIFRGKCTQTFLRTEEYLKDALESVVADIEGLASNLLTFVDAQVWKASNYPSFLDPSSNYRFGSTYRNNPPSDSVTPKI